MKIKKDKKHTKRSHTEESTPEKKDEKNNKMNKKLKLSNVEIENCDDETAGPDIPSSQKSLKIVDNNILKYFNELTSDEEQNRMDATVHLLQQIQRTKEPEKRQIELDYILRRLIRGCGASTNASRAGFFTGLVGILKMFNCQDITMEKVFKTLKKQLHVGATIANKEDADAVVGKILVCGALLHSGRLGEECENEHLEKVANILLQSSRHRTYHASLGFSFLCEVIESLSQKQFESCIWPHLQQELVKPWPKQTLQSVHCVIATQKKFPKVVNMKFFESTFGGPELLNPESFQYLHKIFWEHSNTDILTHPAFEYFGAYIAKSKHLTQFWCDFVEPGLKNPTKLLEVETLKILTDILDNLNVEQTNVHDLLTNNFMNMLIEGLKTLKQKKDETLKAFYRDFLESLVKCCGRIGKDAGKVAVIKRLILKPGIFNIEKFTGNRIIHQLINSLSEDGVRDIFNLYKSIFLGTLAKNPENSEENWLNFERLNAGYMLQHLLQHQSVQTSYKWRGKQLKFLFTCGVFYVTDAATICKKEETGKFCNDFGNQCKNMFYTCLQGKFSDIQQEQQLLFKLAEYCQENILQKHAGKYFRVQKFNDSLQKSWKNMFDNVSETIKSDSNETHQEKKMIDTFNRCGNKLQAVFNILLLHMGLQLFREAEMAGPAIDDLLKCMEKTRAKIKNKKSKVANGQDEEPEWIEVVIDLFLHLLSQNNSALRNIVNALFPRLSDNMTLTAVHQILSMLDMKDGNNPLNTKNEDEEEDDNDSEEENEDLEEKALENGIDSDSENEDDDEEDDDEDDDEAEDDNEDEDGVTANDKLRNAISQALITNSSATGDDDDIESIDLNEMTEEEGQKLDEALANAFKALKKSGAGNTQSKKSKSFRIKTTTVMHFRIRVIDLIEMYLQQKPSLLIAIEIMLALYNMLQYCVGDKLKPLQTKVEKVLVKLTKQKNYATDDGLKEENFVDFMRLVVEKKAPAVVYDIVNKMRNKCTCFLILNAQKQNPDVKIGKLLQLCQEYIHEFIKSRNPIINVTLLTDLFKLNCQNVWNIAEDLTQQGLNLQTLTFRRIQIYEVLSCLYKNNNLQKQDVGLTKKHLKRIEKSITKHIKVLCENDTNAKHSVKEFQTLLDLIITAEKAHQLLQLPTALTSETTLNSLQNLRKHIHLESENTYQRFCNKFKQPIIRNSDIQSKSKPPSSNGTESESKKGQDEREAELDEDNALVAKKRKLNAKDMSKLKKQKKQQRLEAASRGLNGGIGFTQRNCSNKDHKVDNDKDSD